MKNSAGSFLQKELDQIFPQTVGRLGNGKIQIYGLINSWLFLF